MRSMLCAWIQVRDTVYSMRGYKCMRSPIIPFIRQKHASHSQWIISKRPEYESDGFCM